MNFFEHQDQARRQTRWLVVLFILAVLAIIATVDLALLLAFGLSNMEYEASPFTAQGIQANLPLLAGGALATASVIGLASLFKTASLRGGGGTVARAGFENFGASSLDFALQFDVPGDDWATAHDTRNRVLVSLMKRFAAEGISIPYPTQTTYTAAPDGTLVMPYPQVQPVEVHRAN